MEITELLLVKMFVLNVISACAHITFTEQGATVEWGRMLRLTLFPGFLSIGLFMLVQGDFKIWKTNNNIEAYGFALVSGALGKLVAQRVIIFIKSDGWLHLIKGGKDMAKEMDEYENSKDEDS